MQTGVVVGKAVSTTKHSSMTGFRLLLVQPLALDGGPDAEPILAIDTLGSAIGDRVIVTSDGKSTRELTGRKDSPVRYAIIGIEDERGDRR